MKGFFKDSDAILDYVVLWSSWLDGDTIINASFSVDDTALVVSSVSYTSTTATVILSGGIVNTTYTVTCHITTSQGRTEDRSFEIKVINR